MKTAIIGHFSPFSTETQLAYQLERMGHGVKRIDENEDIVASVLGQSKQRDLVILVGSHGKPDNGEFQHLRKLGIKSCTIHLDKFLGIPGRDPLNGRHWATDRQFTADWDIKLKTHEFMRPAIDEVYCHYGVPREEWKCEVAFVGARDSYHAEYPFRRRLVDWLTARYGSRFIHVGDGQKVHGHDLNDFYASAKVIVGDWYGGGTYANYTSDRLPETEGRGGLLLTPYTEGVGRSPLLTYQQGDLLSVQDRIEWCLTHPKECMFLRHSAFLLTRMNDTYRHRMERVIRWAKSR